jgi:hypothetical protein
MWRTDFANITKMPMLGHVKLDHRLNSVLATKTVVIELSDLDGPEEGSIDQLLHSMIGEVSRPWLSTALLVRTGHLTARDSDSVTVESHEL